jgi:hypothetical protein
MENDSDQEAEKAWQRLRQAILECQAESAQSEDNQPTKLSRARVRRLGDELVDVMENRRRSRVA